MLDGLAASLTKLLTGVAVNSQTKEAFRGPCIYFANHSSHLDFLIVWSSLPVGQRRRTVPIAAKDYWSRGGLRRFLATRAFHALLVDRDPKASQGNPLDPMVEVLEEGRSLILFPEGTRSRDGRIGSFKPGLYHLAKRVPQVSLVPVYLNKLNRILPKGEVLPVPVMCSALFGFPMQLGGGEDKADFLERTRAAVMELAPLNDRSHLTAQEADTHG